MNNLFLSLLGSLCVFVTVTAQVHADPHLGQSVRNADSLTRRYLRCRRRIRESRHRDGSRPVQQIRLNFEHIGIQASAPSLAVPAGDEIQFLYCAADATIPTLAAGIGGKWLAVHFVEKNPDNAKSAIAKAMRTNDAEAR